MDTPAAAAAECRRMICMVETADQAEAVEQWAHRGLNAAKMDVLSSRH